MCALKVSLLVMIVSYVAAEQRTKIIACKRSDIPCVSALTQRVARGFPEHYIPPADPVTIPELQIEDSGFLVLLKNIHVTGLGNLEVNDFKVDKKSIVLSMTAPLQVYSEVNLLSKDAPFAYSGTFKAKIKATATSQYDFDINYDAGSRYYVIGDEKIVGEVDDPPEVYLQFKNNLSKDVNTKWLKMQEQITKVIVKKIEESVFVNVMHNIRSISNILPANTFFVDL